MPRRRRSHSVASARASAPPWTKVTEAPISRRGTGTPRTPSTDDLARLRESRHRHPAVEHLVRGRDHQQEAFGLRDRVRRVLHRSRQLWVSSRRNCASLRTSYLPEMASAGRQPIRAQNSCASPVVCGRAGRARRKFWCLTTRALCRRIDYSALHGDLAVARMNKMGPRFGFHERRARQQFTV